jgi:lipid A 3-O-deacylase
MRRSVLVLLCLFFLSNRSYAEADSLTAPRQSSVPPVRPMGTLRESAQAMSFYIENDSSNLGGPGSDRACTNGVRLAYIDAENHVPYWAAPVLKVSSLFERFERGEVDRTKTNYGFAIAQQLYTPGDIATSSLLANDRPYAAWLYAGFTAHTESDKRSLVLEVDLGVVGPEALGEQTQNSFHDLIKRPRVAGWRHQLSTEPTLQVFYQERRRAYVLASIWNTRFFDLVPYYGIGLGNVIDAVHGGGILRLGYNLPNDFGPTRASSMDGDGFVSPAHNARTEGSVYIFGGLRAIGVARNIFLDGNTFRSSHHVTRNPLVIETELGVGGILYRVNLAWRYVTRTPEFFERNDVTSFASISATLDF